MTAAAMAQNALEGATDGANVAFFVNRLAMTSFRSYDAAEVVSDGRPLVFRGANGAGKTNILEALSMLAPGRGLRGGILRGRIPGGGHGLDGDLWCRTAAP